MEISIYLQTKKMDSLNRSALNEYIKRLSPFTRVSVEMVKCMDEKMIKKIFDSCSSSNTKLYLVTPSKNTLSSEELAEKINQLNVTGISKIVYIIIPSAIEADFDTLSLSSFSLSDELTAVVLTEQLYRAYTILNNITYHK